VRVAKVLRRSRKCSHEGERHSFASTTYCPRHLLGIQSILDQRTDLEKVQRVLHQLVLDGTVDTRSIHCSFVDATVLHGFDQFSRVDIQILAMRTSRSVGERDAPDWNVLPLDLSFPRGDR
jgi:hypothetical protein